MNYGKIRCLYLFAGWEPVGIERVCPSLSTILEELTLQLDLDQVVTIPASSSKTRLKIIIACQGSSPLRTFAPQY